MNDKNLAKKIVGKLLNKSADIVKEVPADSGFDLFRNPASPEGASSEISDKDLFGATSAVDQADREAANLPPEVENTPTSTDESDIEDVDQGYSSSGNKADDVYTGSGDGPKL